MTLDGECVLSETIQVYRFADHADPAVTEAVVDVINRAYAVTEGELFPPGRKRLERGVEQLLEHVGKGWTFVLAEGTKVLGTATIFAEVDSDWGLSATRTLAQPETQDDKTDGVTTTDDKTTEIAPYHLCLVGVDAGMHGRGLGTKLLQAVDDFVRARHPGKQVIIHGETIFEAGLVPYYAKRGFTMTHKTLMPQGTFESIVPFHFAHLRKVVIPRAAQ